MKHCLIIDDNKNTTEIIKSVGLDFPEIEFKEVIENHTLALNTILKNKSEIIFINLESTKINFLEFLLDINQLSKQKPYFIGLSYSKEKAYDSYKHDFSDFLLKPLNELTIRKSLLKFQKKHPNKVVETLCLKSYKDYQYLNIDDILYLKADNNTTDFYMTDGNIIGAYKTLKVFEKLLPKNFSRIHKSYIINRNHISRIHYGKSVCIINNEYNIPFTKTFIDNINLINNTLSKNTVITLN